jgi:hypothetical protein
MASSGADREFPEFHKIILHRMRLYSSVRWFFQWYVGFTAVFAAYLYFVLRSYDYYMREAINSYSIKPLIGAYGASLFFALFLSVDMQYCCSNKRNSLFKTVSDEASIKRGRPKLAASFILGQTCDVACWHETDSPEHFSGVRY